MATVALSYYQTSVGKKMVMAVTGFIVFGWVFAHMMGNLQVFRGPEVLNAYAAFLHSLGKVLWLTRIVMVVAAVLHVIAATQLTLQSWEARPQKYAVQKFRETTYAARTMRWGGPLILAFVIFHLMHLTWGNAHQQFSDNVYNNVVTGFQVVWVSGFYIVAMVAVGLHLYHGVYSMLQTMGINHPQWNLWRQRAAAAFALLVTLGNISMPLAVLAGIVKPV